VTLRTRIAAIAGLAVAVTVLAAAVTVYLAVRSNVRGEVERALDIRAATLGRDDGPGPRGPRGVGRGFGAPPPPVRFGGAEGYVQLVGGDGDVRAPPGSALLPVSDATRSIAREGVGRRVEDPTVDGTHLMILTRGAGPFGAVQIARPLSEADRVLDRVLVALILVGLAGVGIAVLLGAFVARTALGPIERFTRRTEELAGERRIAERIEVQGDDELARLARSFNATLDELEQSVDSQRRLVADASHELRTPISSLRANVQTLEDAHRLPPEEAQALRADIVAELDELTALVGDVVELAREDRPGTALDDVRVDELVQAAAERTGRRAGKTVHLRVSTEPTLVRGEPERIARAIANLLVNARTWSPEGGTVDVVLHDGTLVVRDQGPGFAEEDLPHVFERFYRAKAARGIAGSGLGLAIVRQAAEAHGGSVEAGNAPGGGAELRVRFGDRVALGDSSPALSAGEHADDMNLNDPRPKERA
jgi:two-component system sensor histidine kinase MprB